MTKFKRFFISLLLVSIFINATAQRVTKEYYVSPSFNLPFADFGLPDGVESTTLKASGFCVGAGMLIYLNKPDVEEKLKIGLDFTFIDFNQVNHKVAISNDDVTEYRLNATFGSSRLGPVLSYSPTSKLSFDVYGQGLISAKWFHYYNKYNDRRSSFNFFEDLPPSNIKLTYGLATGIRIGYEMISLNLEYNYAKPTFTVSTAFVDTEKISINHSYVKIGLTVKLRSPRSS